MTEKVLSGKVGGHDVTMNITYGITMNVTSGDDVTMNVTYLVGWH